MVLLGSPGQTCTLKYTITTFKRRSGSGCCLGAPIARPAAASHAILPDRFMRALCEPTRCRPSAAPSRLTNQRHRDKTWGAALSRDRKAGQSSAGDPSSPQSSTRSTHLPPARAGMQRDPQGCPAPGVPALPATQGCPQPSPPSQGQSHPPALRHCAVLIPGFHTFAMPELQPPPQTKPILMRQH